MESLRTINKNYLETPERWKKLKQAKEPLMKNLAEKGKSDAPANQRRSKNSKKIRNWKMQEHENWIIRVEIPDKNLKKAICIDKKCPISDLLTILKYKLADAEFVNNCRFYLPHNRNNTENNTDNNTEITMSTNGNIQNAATAATVTKQENSHRGGFGLYGSWILDENSAIETLFPPSSTNYTRFLQLRKFHSTTLANSRSKQSPLVTFSSSTLGSTESPRKSPAVSRRSSLTSLHSLHPPQNIHLNTLENNHSQSCQDTHHSSNIMNTLEGFTSALRKKKSLRNLGLKFNLNFRRNTPKEQDSNTSLNNSTTTNTTVISDEHSSSVDSSIRFEWFGGCKLEDVPKYPTTGVPILIEKLLNYIEEHDMETEGIFRLSGSASAVKNLKEIFQTSNTGGIDLDLDNLPIQMDGHVAASLLKLFLRELPEPLLTGTLYSAWIAAQETTNHELRLYWIYNLLKVLNTDHFFLLRRLCFFFNRLSLFGDKNKMTLQNLATILGPNILRKETETPLQLVGNAAAVNTIALELIKNCNVLFNHEESLENPSLNCLSRAIYSFTPAESSSPSASNNGELSFKAGDYLFVRGNVNMLDAKNPNNEWLLAEVLGKNSTNIVCGYVPGNYLEHVLSFPRISSLNDLYPVVSSPEENYLQEEQMEILRDDVVEDVVACPLSSILENNFVQAEVDLADKAEKTSFSLDGETTVDFIK